MLFDQETEDSLFENFLTGRACQAASFADFVKLLNMKAAKYADDKKKMEILTEILNDVKLYSQPSQSSLNH